MANTLPGGWLVFTWRLVSNQIIWKLASSLPSDRLVLYPEESNFYTVLGGWPVLYLEVGQFSTWYLEAG
jgi:hypothetical protein